MKKSVNGKKYKLCRYVAVLLLSISFCLSCMPAFASAEDPFCINGGMAVYSISGENWLRESDGNPDGLGKDEYISFYVDVMNTSGKDQSFKNPYFRVDGGEKLCLVDSALKAGQTTRCHIYHVNMIKLGSGSHQVKFYINDKLVYSNDFRLIRDWRSVMNYPSDSQKEAVRGGKRSPYIVFYPQFKGTEGITEYSIDFQIDDMDDGTYFSTLDADLDISALTKKYASVSNDYSTPGGFYCGVQRWENGRTGVIMSVWDNICKDKKGRETIICANQLYPEFKAGESKTSGEGRFQQFTQEFPIHTRTPYRILIQMSQSQTTGNTELTMWICDLSADLWTELVSWDLGYKSRFIKTKYMAGFLENYLTAFSGSIRNVSFFDIRGKSSEDGKWKAAKTVRFTVNNSIHDLGYKGSYNFGSDDSTFWIITSGVEGLCRLPESGSSFSVKNASNKKPY